MGIKPVLKICCPLNPTLTTDFPASVAPTCTSAKINRWSELGKPPGRLALKVPTKGKFASVLEGQYTPELVVCKSVEGST